MNQSRALLVALLVVLLSGSAYAQDDLNLLTKVVPTNVMIMIDNSGSMSHAMWAGGFDQKVFYDTGTVTTACDIGVVPAQVASAGFCPASGALTGQCPDSGSSIAAGNKVTCDSASIPGGCASAMCRWLPTRNWKSSTSRR